jgi:hypothetical protein
MAVVAVVVVVVVVVVSTEVLGPASEALLNFVELFEPFSALS